MPKLLMVVTEDWYLVSHRLALALAARGEGYDVYVATRLGEHRKTLEEAGLTALSFEMSRRGLSPLVLLREALALARLMRRERADVVHLVALRPVVVGGVAARLAGQRGVVAALTGMGFLFTGGGRLPWVRRLLRRTLPWLLGRGPVIVQNRDDAAELQAFGVPARQLRLIPGAGVDTVRFAPMSVFHPEPVVMMASRLLWDKGVGEFVEAARLLRGSARFVLVGDPDPDNPASIDKADLDAWQAEGAVECWGHSQDMAASLAQADLFCLPSYREGLPKALLEAMAAGLACVTTDVPGCREAVRHEENGLLVPARDSAVLAAAIKRLLDDPDLRQHMAMRGRELALTEFNQDQVTAATLWVYREALS